MTQYARSIVAFFTASLLAVLPACTATPKAVAPTGAGNYMLTVRHADTGRPIEGVVLVATGAGASARGAASATATTDEDGIAVLRFGTWGAVDLRVTERDVTERWLVTQDRVAVNGGKSAREPLRLMVGSRSNGGASAFVLSITRIERGGKIDVD